MRLLLLSNSTNAGEQYLQSAIGTIKQFLGNQSLNGVFVPYAGITITWDNYSNLVKEKFNETGQSVQSVHLSSDPRKAIEEAGFIVVGGGNTFHLLKYMQQNKLIEVIKKKVVEGTPYIGWSAGANVACPTIKTTNDMPVVQPQSFDAINLVPFQINPHYLDANPAGHAGETREARILEFIEVNPDVIVTGLREGTCFQIENTKMIYKGTRTVRIFKKGTATRELDEKDDFSFLIK
ncbi:MAG: dipeptidase PepE [Bacteroidales bacterium]|nr:dipeptidase PepE [Bacteroidales bacterium]